MANISKRFRKMGPTTEIDSQVNFRFNQFLFVATFELWFSLTLEKLKSGHGAKN